MNALLRFVVNDELRDSTNTLSNAQLLVLWIACVV